MPTNPDHLSPEAIAERRDLNSRLFLAAEPNVRTSGLLARALVYALKGLRQESRDWEKLEDDDFSCVLELAEVADREIAKVTKIYDGAVSTAPAN